uniref:Uncharacterized protein n=1 Tax=uncultured organism MedDCM-OCT-S08-C1394 TaxID=743629 RepID=D6PKL0_9ZZZZ|nr:hypothetical protein [uncultured organism MedDCM-OCT-S08-C1394]
MEKSRFNYLDRDTIVTPDTCTHSMYTFTGKEYPSAVCVTGFEGCYQVIVVLMRLIVTGIRMQ